MAPSNTRSERIASRNGVSRRVGLIRLCYRLRNSTPDINGPGPSEGAMQRYIARRVLQSFLAIWVMSLIVFALARLSGNALDVMLPMESTQEDYDRLAKYWGLDQPLHVQYGIFIARALQGDFGMSWKWP